MSVSVLTPSPPCWGTQGENNTPDPRPNPRPFQNRLFPLPDLGSQPKHVPNGAVHRNLLGQLLNWRHFKSTEATFLSTGLPNSSLEQHLLPEARNHLLRELHKGCQLLQAFGWLFLALILLFVFSNNPPDICEAGHWVNTPCHQQKPWEATL